MDILETKKCTKCLSEKSLKDFNKNAGSKDGLDFRCKGCRKEARKKYRESESGKAAIQKQYWDNLEKEKERLRKRSGTPEYLAYQKEYREKNKDAVNERKRRWDKKNEIYYKVRNHVKLAKDKGLFIEWDKECFSRLMEKHAHKCCLTGETDYIEIDHFVAISTGHCGTYEGNMIPLVAGLNSSKSNKNPFVWIDTQSKEVQKEFGKVVNSLSKENNLSPEEFREFVSWCYDNPRSDGDISNYPNFNSIDTWNSNRIKSST